jgi:hypothetical protein
MSAARAWRHYPLQRWAGFDADYLQPEETTAMAPLAAGHSPQRDLYRRALALRSRQDRAPAARLPEGLAHGPEKDA